jgi:hypothetical protein
LNSAQSPKYFNKKKLKDYFLYNFFVRFKIMSRQRSGRELGTNIEPDIATHLQPINSKINSLTTLINRLTLMQGK